MTPRPFLLLFFAFSYSLLSAQSFEIAGRIIDSESGDPLPYATIRYGDRGTYANENGYYAFRANSDGQQIQVSYVGYADTTLRAGTLRRRPTLALRSIARQLT